MTAMVWLMLGKDWSWLIKSQRELWSPALKSRALHVHPRHPYLKGTLPTPLTLNVSSERKL